MYHDFDHHDTMTIKIHSLAHILDTWTLIFSSCALFTVYPYSIPPLSM